MLFVPILDVAVNVLFVDDIFILVELFWQLLLSAYFLHIEITIFVKISKGVLIQCLTFSLSWISVEQVIMINIHNFQIYLHLAVHA